METLKPSNLKALYHNHFGKAAEKELPYEAWLLERERCRTDLWFLAKEVLQHDLVECHKAVVDLFVKKDNSKPITEQDAIKFRLLLYPRGGYKTTLDRVDAVQWHLNFPLIRIAFFSANYDFAKDELLIPAREYFVKRNKTTTRFQKLFPEYCINEEQVTDNNDWFSPVGKPTVPTFYSNGIEAGLSGRHFDVMKCDDCVSNKNSRTADQLQKTIEGFNTSKPMVTSVNGYLDLIGTRYHLADLYGYFLEQFDPTEIKILIDQAWKVLPHAVNKTIAELEPSDVVLLFPEGLSFKTLKREAKDPRSFACQYLNDPVAAALTSFTRDLLESRSVAYREIPSKVLIYQAWDFAFSTKRNRDYTVGVTAALDEQGRLFVIDVVRGRYQPSELAYKVAEWGRQYKPQLIRIENANGSDFLSGEVRRNAANLGVPQLPLDFFRVINTKGAKENRINSIQSLMKAGRILLCNTISDMDTLYKEFCEFPGGAHDDIPDCISHLLAVMPALPNAPANSEAFIEIYKTLKRKRQLEEIFGGSEPLGIFDPTIAAEDVPQVPSEYEPSNPWGNTFGPERSI